MQRFYVNPRNGNLLTLSDTRADRSLGVTQERFLPVVVDEVAQKDADQNVWRVRHLDWAFIEARLEQRTHCARPRHQDQRRLHPADA
jgi:hypothetical protein